MYIVDAVSGVVERRIFCGDLVSVLAWSPDGGRVATNHSAYRRTAVCRDAGALFGVFGRFDWCPGGRRTFGYESRTIFYGAS